MVACLFGGSSLPTLHFGSPPSRTFTPLSPIQFTITLSITQPVVVTLSLLTADFRPHILSILPQHTYHFHESTTHKFEDLYISELREDKIQEVLKGSGDIEEADLSRKSDCDWRRQKDTVRIMVEAATPSASTVIVSDTIHAEYEPLKVVKASRHNTENAQETVWALFNKEILDATVLVVHEGKSIPAKDIRITGKVIIFTLPVLESHSNLDDVALNNDRSVDVQITCGCEHATFSLVLNPSARYPEGASERDVLVRSLFAFACEGDPLTLVTPLVPLLSATDTDQSNALHLAARHKQNFALKTILTALRDTNNDETLKKVLNAQNVRGQTPLHCAVRAGDADCVHYLVSAGADKHLTDNNQNTVAHYLGEVYNEAIYKEILETSNTEQSEEGEQKRESPLASKNSEGYTPVHIAVRKLKLGLLEALIEAGAPLDTRDNCGETPMITAVLMDDVEIASLLIRHNCDVNAVTKMGDTPLGIACRKKNLIIIGRLLDAGANPEQPDKEGRRPRDSRDEEVQRILNGERIREEVQPESNEEAPHEHSSDSSEHAAAYSYRLRTVNSDDISSLDYLTRLRLSKILDAEEKWATLADHLGCGHMVEFIRVCADETSSPTMILLDQYEQIPNANLATVTQSLEDMGEVLGARLTRSGNEQA